MLVFPAADGTQQFFLAPIKQQLCHVRPSLVGVRRLQSMNHTSSWDLTVSAMDAISAVVVEVRPNCTDFVHLTGYRHLWTSRFSTFGTCDGR